jgi:methyl halide transferase
MWEASYKSGFHPWQRREINPAFRAWFNKDASLEGLSVLVPGCGTSLEPVEFAKRGARVTCLEIAPTALEDQRRQFGEAALQGQMIVADVTVWSPPEHFDVIYEQTCLCAMPPKDRSAYEQFAFRALKSSGALYCLFMQTGGSGGPPFHCDIAQMKALFSPARWNWAPDSPIRSNHPLGVHELGFVLKRRAA